VVEIGVAGADGEFVAVARSGRIDLPRAVPAAPAPVAPESVRWMTVSPIAAPGAPAPLSTAWPSTEVVPVAGPANPFVPPATIGVPSLPAVMALGVSSLSSVLPGPGASNVWSSVSSSAGASQPSSPESFVLSGVGRGTRATGPVVVEPQPIVAAEPPRAAATDAASRGNGRARPGEFRKTAPDASLPQAPPAARASEHLYAAEAVWSPSDVSERREAPAKSVALERRQLPQLARDPAAGSALAAPPVAPGLDQIAAGLASAGRGLLQVVGGAVRVIGGVAKLGAWATSKAIERLRKK
jgi:hypothetical protein